MPWSITYNTAANPDAELKAGVFLPLSALPGITEGTELDDSSREVKIALALGNRIHTALAALPNKLGVATTKAAPAGVTPDVFNQAFTYVADYVCDHRDNAVAPVPLPASGAGKISLAQAFGPDAVIVADGDVLPDEGITIPSDLIGLYGGIIPDDVDADARSWLAALYYGMVLNQDTTSPAVILAERGDTEGVVPADNIASISALRAEDLPRFSFFQVTFFLTVQLVLNQVTQKFDVVV